MPSDAAVPRPAHRRKLFWVALLYFGEGLPLGVFYDLFPVHFRQQGVNLAEIGLLSLLGLAWTIKFLWAPLIDWTRHHRRWIAAAHAGMAAVLLGFGLLGGAEAGGGVAGGVWIAIGLFTLLSATNDIATDGHTIEMLDRKTYGLANGLRIGFYRAGMLMAGGLLVVSGTLGWTAAWLLGAAVFGLNALMALAAPREIARTGPLPQTGGLRRELARLRAQPRWLLALGLVLAGLLWPVLGPLARAMGWDAITAVAGSAWFRGALPVGLMLAGATLLVRAARHPEAAALAQGPAFGAWIGLLTRPGMVAVLLFILSFKLGDAAMGFMVKPYWVDAGFSSAQIGLVSVNLGLGLSIAGGLIGGWYVDRVGLFRGLWVLGLWQALSNLGYALVASLVPAGSAAQPALPPDLAAQALVYSASALESLTGGLGTGAFLAFLMGITGRARATTEYAILSSVFAFSRAVAGWAGGLGAEAMGYPAYFFLTFWLAFPAYALLPAVKRMVERPADDPV